MSQITQIDSYRNLLSEKLSNLNETFNPYGFSFKLGDSGYSFDDIYIDTINKNIYWAKVFILKNEVQIGRITFRFENNSMKLYYIKQYKPSDYEYDSNDDIFYYLKFYLTNQPIPKDLTKFINAAETIREFYIAKTLIWRLNNPVKDQLKISKNGKVWKSHRKKVQGKKIRYILDKLIDWVVYKTENPFPEFMNYIISLKGKQNNTADLFLYFY